MRSIRGREIALVLQSPTAALNPALRIGTQLREAWRAHCARDARKKTDRILESLACVNLPSDEAFLRRYPSQLSVGQAQRVLIAMAVLHRPRLLVADEPTSALDSITMAEVLELFGKLNRELEMAIVYISHDLLSVSSLCHRVAILAGGKVVECAPTMEIFSQPAHPYTRRLIAAVPTGPALVPASEEPELLPLLRATGVKSADRAVPTR